ncbi:MAG: Na(+)/H(+) antiporter subunit D, partial [Haloferacaceae archaeon]
MTAALAAVPPYALLFALALAAVALPRRAGNAAAVVGALAAAAWLLAVPAGAHLPTTLFGFDAVLFHVDVYSRLLGATLGLIAAAGVAYGHAAGADRRQTAYALAYLGTGMGATLAGDWLTLVVFWELMALCATALVWHRAADRA